MENFERKIENDTGKNNFTNKIEITINESIPEINVNKESILESKKEIDRILGKEWDLSKEKIQTGIFSKRKELNSFAQEKEIPTEKLTNDSALFYINPNTQEKYIFVIKSFEENKKMLEDMGYSEK